MKFIGLSLATAVALLIGAAASAATGSLPVGMTAVPLATITNDRDISVSRIKLILDDQAFVRGIYLETSASGDSEQSEASGQMYWVDEIDSPNGVVLGQGQGVKAIFLRGEIDPQGKQDSLVIKYLTNGIFKKYAECRVSLKRLSPYNWQLVNAYNGRPISLIQVRTWMLGISTLVNVCPDGAAEGLARISRGGGQHLVPPYSNFKVGRCLSHVGREGRLEEGHLPHSTTERQSLC